MTSRRCSGKKRRPYIKLETAKVNINKHVVALQTIRHSKRIHCVIAIKRLVVRLLKV